MHTIPNPVASDIDPRLPFRILVTGWRNWPLQDRSAVHNLLDTVTFFIDRPIVVVNGACPYGGVDNYAAEWADQRHHGVEYHRAEIGPRGQILGPERNSRMVAKGANICLGFPGPNSRGTWDCIRKAVDAGIQTEILCWSQALSRTLRNG